MFSAPGDKWPAGYAMRAANAARTLRLVESDAAQEPWETGAIG